MGDLLVEELGLDYQKKLIIRVFQNNVLFANVIVVSLSSGQVNRIVVCGFSNAQATI